jgi:hypothetical protein
MNEANSPLPAGGAAGKTCLALRAAGGLLLIALGMLLSACGLLRAPQQVVTAVIPSQRPKGPEPLDLQLQVQRFADEFGALSAAGIDEYVRRVGTDAARLEGLRWKLGIVSAAVSIPSGPRPKANLLDMVALVTLARMTVEDRIFKSTSTSAVQPFVEAIRFLETNVWNLASNALDPSQLKELREAIVGWHARNPEVGTAFFARPQEFAPMVKSAPEKSRELTSVFSLVNLDPTAGLDPAVREITLTRLFAERAMYTAQRLPFVLRLQAELLTEQVTQQPAVQRVITNTALIGESMDRISRGWENTSQTITQLPDRISAERKEILAALDQQEGKLRGLASEVNQSLVSAEKMSTSLNTTLTTFDALMKRFGVGEPSTNTPPKTNSRPFNVLDYGTVAGQIDTMAKDLNTLVTSVNQGVPQLTQISQQASAEAERVVTRAFRLGLVLILVLLVGSVLAALTYRILAGKLSQSPSRPLPPNQ